MKARGTQAKHGPADGAHAASGGGPEREPFVERAYRDAFRASDLAFFRVRVEQTDLYIGVGDRSLDGPPSGKQLRAAEEVAVAVVADCRERLQAHIRMHPAFLTSLEPLAEPGLVPVPLAGMYRAAAAAGVGPMAAVAGAVAEQVGRALNGHFSEVLVENGGDLWMTGTRRRVAGLFCGNSPLNGKLGLVLPAGGFPLGLCTSSGTIGHSMSFGRADAATVKAGDAYLADAVATALGNRVRTADEIDAALAWASAVPGVTGLLVVLGDRMGAWGDMELTLLTGGMPA